MKEENINLKQREQQGSGSAENKGSSREDQKSNKSIISEEERNKIAADIGVPPEAITDLKGTGALSGRDDAAGGSGDDMNSTSSNQATERF